MKSLIGERKEENKDDGSARDLANKYVGKTEGEGLRERGRVTPERERER